MTEHSRPMQTSRSFSFGPFTLFPGRQLLLHDDAAVRVGGRAMDILTMLVERPGDVVSKRELMARAWPGLMVDEGNLKVNVAALRKILSDGPGAETYIATVTGRGYRFIAPVGLGGALALVSEPRATPLRSHNLPIATTRIFGRTDVTQAIQRELRGSRLVSIVGTGGIGKTTVALAVAEQALGSFKDGVWLVDLALSSDPDMVPNVIATTIGLAVQSPDILGDLCEYIRGREILLILDSCEHVIDAVAACASRILTNTFGVKILVTSRESLRVNGERVRRLPALDAPPTQPGLRVAQALTFPAMQLFVDRATDSFEQFKLSDADAPVAAEICQRLDGLPLAIELAATRVEAFGIGGLLKQLDDRFSLLAGRRDGPERHRTLTATLDWSYGLLSPRETALLRSVSVFAGTFDIEGALATSKLTLAETVETLAQLSAKSLLATCLDGNCIAYHLLDTTRGYCLERLRASGDEQLIRLRHADYMLTVLDRAARDWSERPISEWTVIYGRVLDDLRNALSWTKADDAHRPLRMRLTRDGVLLLNHFSLTEDCLAHVPRAVEEHAANFSAAR